MSCITPYHVKQNQEEIPVPCGKCPECIKRRISGWSFRLVKEGERSTSAHFVTLTYNTDYVPITQKGFMTLKKRDLQLFFKRLRKISAEALRYYACGEYGGKTNRPHYHIILFNAQVKDIEKSWGEARKVIKVYGRKVFKVPVPATQFGGIFYGDVQEASIGYCLKYMSKPGKIPVHQNDDRSPEFSLMSKRLGDNYLTKAMSTWHKKDLENRMHLVLKDGKKIAMPRYFKDKLYTDKERKRISFLSKIDAEKRQVKKEDELYKKYGENWQSIVNQSNLAKFEKVARDAKKRNKI